MGVERAALNPGELVTFSRNPDELKLGQDPSLPLSLVGLQSLRAGQPEAFDALLLPKDFKELPLPIVFDPASIITVTQGVDQGPAVTLPSGMSIEGLRSLISNIVTDNHDDYFYEEDRIAEYTAIGDDIRALVAANPELARLLPGLPPEGPVSVGWLKANRDVLIPYLDQLSPAGAADAPLGQKVPPVSQQALDAAYAAGFEEGATADQIPGLRTQLADLRNYAVALANKLDASNVSEADRQLWTQQLETARLDIRTLEGRIDSATVAAGVPFTEDQLTRIQQRGAEIFFDKLAAAPDGSPAKILYNLFRAKSLQDVKELEGNIDIDRINTDIRALMNDPEIQALLHEAQSEAAQEIIGVDSAAAAQQIADQLLDPEMIATLKRLDPETRETLVNHMLTQLAFFDPALAKEVQQKLVAEMLGGGDPAQQMLDASPEALELAVQSIFQISITQSRFGFGALGNAGSALNKLTDAQFKEGTALYAQVLRQVVTENPDLAQDSAEFKTLLDDALAKAAADPEVVGALRAFSKALGDTGALGAVGGVLAGIAVVNDFRGEGSAEAQTPWGIVSTTADVMTLVGATENFVKFGKFLNGLKSLGLDAESMGIFRGLADLVGRTNAANPGALAETLEGVELADLGAIRAAVAADAEQLGIAAEEVDEVASTIYETASESSYAEFFDALQSFEAGETEVFEDLVSTQVGEMLGGGVSDAGEIAALTESAVSEFGMSEAEAAAAGAMVGEMAAEGEAAVSEAGVLTLGSVLKGLGVLGSVANFLYGAKSINAAVDAAEKGDTTGAVLNSFSAAGLLVGGGAGVAGFIGTTFEIAALSGPAFPIVAAVAGVVGFAFSIGNYFHQKHEHDKQIHALKDFLENGVGNGVNYYQHKH